MLVDEAKKLMCPFGGDCIDGRANYWIQVDPATVEQFIGLTDKYSKKMIFYERSMLL